MKKKVIAAVLSVCVCMSAAIPAFAAEPQGTEQQIEYTQEQDAEPEGQGADRGAEETASETEVGTEIAAEDPVQQPAGESGKDTDGQDVPDDDADAQKSVPAGDIDAETSAAADEPAKDLPAKQQEKEAGKEEDVIEEPAAEETSEEEREAAAAAGFYTDKNGNKRYRKADGKDAKGFMKIDGKTYYFMDTDCNGYTKAKAGIMMTGFRKICDKNGTVHTYYFDSAGIMQTGFRWIGRNYYHFTSAGIMDAGGWKTISGKRCHFHDDGTMSLGWEKIDGKMYFFTEDPLSDDLGGMQTGWMVHLYRTGNEDLKPQKYHFASSGVLDTGLKTIGGKKYYFSTSNKTSGDLGRMLTGWRRISGKSYYFNTSTGVMETKARRVTIYAKDNKGTAADSARFTKGFTSSLLYAEVEPSNAANKNVIWTSSNTNVVKVNKTTGAVTPVAKGSAVITCTSAENSKAKAQINVSVEERTPSSIKLTGNSTIRIKVGKTASIPYTVTVKNGTVTDLKDRCLFAMWSPEESYRLASLEYDDPWVIKDGKRSAVKNPKLKIKAKEKGTFYVYMFSEQDIADNAYGGGSSVAGKETVSNRIRIIIE